MPSQPGSAPRNIDNGLEATVATAVERLSKLLVEVKKARRIQDEGPLQEEDLMDMYDDKKLPKEVADEVGELTADEKVEDDGGVFPVRVIAIFDKYRHASKAEFEKATDMINNAKKVEEVELEAIVKEIQNLPNARRVLAGLTLALNIDEPIEGYMGVDGTPVKASGYIRALTDALSDELTSDKSLSQTDSDYMQKLEAIESRIRKEMSPELIRFAELMSELQETLS